MFTGAVWQDLVLWFRLLATDFFANSGKEVSKKTPPQHLSPAKSAGCSQNSTLKTGAAELATQKQIHSDIRSPDPFSTHYFVTELRGEQNQKPLRLPIGKHQSISCVLALWLSSFPHASGGNPLIILKTLDPGPKAYRDDR